MARNTLRLDTKGLEGLLKKLDSVGGDVESAVAEALGKASRKIKTDTVAAMASSNLPAHGKYSEGTTSQSIVQDTQPRWEGNVAWVPVGFDFSEPGAGGYLITGTPRMRPNTALNRMYKQRKYMKMLQDEMSDVILGHITKKMTEG